MSARDFWIRIESIHAVTYFAPESRAAAGDAGLQGFWMGYFGFRAAPMGAVTAGVVEAAFANFAPSMVRRAIPDAWSYADPGSLVEARASAAAAALRAAVPDIDGLAADLNPMLERAAGAGSPLGRPLFAANLAVSTPDDPVEQLWQWCTTLREHRGDGHVAALAAAGIDGCQAHQLLVAERGLPPALFFDNRGWDEEAQHTSLEVLRSRGLVQDEELTDLGAELRAQIEAITDERAIEPYDAALAATEQSELLDALTPLALAIQRSDVIPFPNPMGLPEL
ncbi:MAG: hypothetical protein AAF480_06590 [Actinomycetota bacterium]